MKYVVTLVLSLFLFGCSNRPPTVVEQEVSTIPVPYPDIKYFIDESDGMIVHFKGTYVAGAINSFFPEVDTIMVTDNLYALLEEEWINDFSKYYRENGIKTEYHRLHDCDDQTNAFMSLIKQKHYEKLKSVEPFEIDGLVFPADGIGVGEVYYIPDENVLVAERSDEEVIGHAVNMFLFYDIKGKRIGYCFYDPNTYKFFIPSETEKKSVFFVKF